MNDLYLSIREKLFKIKAYQFHYAYQLTTDIIPYPEPTVQLCLPLGRERLGYDTTTDIT